MVLRNRYIIKYLFVSLVVVQLLPCSDAGIKQVLGDAYNKVKSVFQCSSHESHDEHMQALQDGSVNTLEGISEGRSINGDSIISSTTTSNRPTIPTTTTDFPRIDIRFQDDDRPIGNENGRAIIRAPPNCPIGFRPDHTGKCRELV